MGISLLTALTIQENGADVAVFEDKSSGKYAFQIYSIIREKYRPHATSEPAYESSEEAKQAGTDILDQVNSLDLSEQKNHLSNTLGENGEVVSKIIEASKKDL